MKYTIETEQEDDGRWLAEILEIPGVMKYGETREKAIANAKALLFRVFISFIILCAFESLWHLLILATKSQRR
jgi:hypothetical protein